MKKELPTVRFGILHSNSSLAAWEYKAVGQLLAAASTSLVLVVQAEPLAAPPVSPGLWKSYLKWFFNPPAMRAAITLREVAQQIPSATYSVLPQSAEAAIALIGEHQLDFILSFTNQPLDNRLLALPRLGVWAFRFGRLPKPFAAPVGFWEIYTGEPTTTAVLCQLLASDNAVVLRQGTFRTQWHSPSHTAAAVYAECQHWPSDSCRAWQAGAEMPRACPSPPTPVALPSAPGNAAMAAFLQRLVQYKLRHLYQRFLRADQWNLGVVNRPIRDFLRPGTLQDATIEVPPLPNRNVFYADGFARQEAAGTAIYFERYDYRVRRGDIYRLAYPWLPGQIPTPVISFPYHLSYPFLFGPYCLPEAYRTNSIRLYDLRAPITAPAAGQVLVEAPGVDATLLKYQGRYWLFYARADREPMLNLFIAYADTLQGPWHEHPQNPVKTDIRTARPAGPFFEEAGRLYRPAQDCAADYGFGVVINEVLTLTTTAYAEREVMHHTSPHPDYPAGMHTLAALDATHTLIDFKRYRFVPFATLVALWGVVGGIIFPHGRKSRHLPPISPPSAG